MNQANISPELSALFTLQRAASSGQASFKTPSGGDTIAAKLAQQGEPPQDPNVMGIAQNVQQAGPTMQQNAQNAQAQQVAQQAAGIMQQQQQAQPPQGMAHGGIAALPASNMRNFRQGGVLGFNGEKKNNPVPEEIPAESYPVTEENATPEQRALAELGRAIVAQNQPEPEPLSEPAKVLAPPPEARRVPLPPTRDEAIQKAYESYPQQGLPAITRGLATGAGTRRENPSQSMEYSPEIAATMAETKAMRAQKLPEIANREALLRKFDEQYKNPAIEQRASLKGLGGLQEQVLARQQALYEKEKAGRQSEGWGEYLRGAAAGPGRGPAAAAAYDEKIRAREVGRTKEMTDNIDFQKGIVALQHTANKDEHTEMLKRVADTVTDSQKAAELFEKDKAAMLASLRGDLGPQMQAWAKQIHDAEIAKTRAEQLADKKEGREATLAQRDREAQLRFSAHLNSDAVKERISKLPKGKQGVVELHARSIFASMVKAGADENDPNVMKKAFDQAIAKQHESGTAAVNARVARDISAAMETSKMMDRDYNKIKNDPEKKAAWEKDFIAKQRALLKPDATPASGAPQPPTGFTPVP